MKKVILGIIILFGVFCLNVSLAQAMGQAVEKPIKTEDVNKDGKADVSYYGDAKTTGRIEADTNYDGQPDVVVNTKEGKFQSAEIDTDHNGSLDTTVTDASQFKQWINTNRPEFKQTLGRADWSLMPPDFLGHEVTR